MSAPTSVDDCFAPVTFLTAGSRRYAKSNALNFLDLDYQRIHLDAALGRRISDAYMAAPAWDDSAIPAYQAFRQETSCQFRFLTSGGGLGVTVQFVSYDPYTAASSMASDLRSGHLMVYATAASGNPHPYLNNLHNDMFRAVHDAFGHAATGCGFDLHGEEAAWQKHSTMYTPLASQALATETRGQSCALNFHYRGLRFPAQKLALLPVEFARPPQP